MNEKSARLRHPTSTAGKGNSTFDRRLPNLAEALRLIAAGTAPVTGDEFFRSLVRNLALALNVDIAFVTEFQGMGTRVRTLARWEKNDFGPNIEFDFRSTPCREVIEGKFTHYPECVAELFPDDKPLATKGIESYLGVPLRDRNDEVTLGHLAIMDTRPFAADSRGLEILEIFAARARAELERMHFEERLQASERRLGTVLASAMDAIVTIDADWNIMLFNGAAEKLFGCRREEVLSRSMERFMSKRLRDFFHSYLQDFGERAARRGPLWAPSGLTALRADGSEFAIEATISPFDIDDDTGYTFIIRDINERLRSERAVKRLENERRYLEEKIRAEQGYRQLLGSSNAIKAVLANVDRVAPTDSTVLIVGETGTGKELVAHAIHERSRRRDHLLVTVNCAALPRELVESELFGHEKGAFTGATTQKKGRFELADKGSLFLDEVGELPLETQVKLLRVLQEHEFERVGGTDTIKVDVRVIAATNRNLAELVDNNEFRHDLYYRLNVFPIEVRPLRDRISDVPQLAAHFLEHFAAGIGKTITGVSDATLARFESYSWPGNVRELRNVIERAAILCDGPLLEYSELNLPDSPGNEMAGDVTLEAVERAHVTRVLESTDWVIEGARGAANRLGLHPNTLRARLKKLGIRRPTRVASPA